MLLGWMDFNKFSEGFYKLEGNHNFEDRLQIQDWMIKSTLKSTGQLPGTHSLNLYSADFPQYFRTVRSICMQIDLFCIIVL